MLFQVPLTKIFNSTVGTQNLTKSPGDLINGLLPNIFVAAGIVFLFIIFRSGFSLIGKAGSSASAQDSAKSKAALTMGVVGFLLVISGYFILEAIMTSLGLNNLDTTNILGTP